ncbi:copper resistance protein [Devosia soli]|uniref:Copper resistance protein n=1 Tax=Devosia soli TaxID=361041 RepID=A0A0F5L7B7_9HYPH|nr:copper resistance protein [Devosia soli]
MRHVGRFAVLGVSAFSLAACASFSPNGGMTPVASRVGQELGQTAAKIVTAADEVSAMAKVEALLAKPLTADSAVQIALLKNRGLQAEYNALGISEADYVEASLPMSPAFSIGKLIGGGELEIERRLVGSILSLFTLPARRAVAEAEFKAASFRAVDATFRLAAETRRAYYNAVASRQLVALLEKGQNSAEAAADLTVKLGETGAATKLEQARASAFYAEVSAELAEAKMRAGVDRETLTRLMGLWGMELNFKLPGQLPPLPDRVPSSERLEADAVTRRVDLMVARLELEAMEKSLGLTKASRYVTALDLAGMANTTIETGEDGTSTADAYGFEIELEIPIFDLGETGVRRSTETYMQAVNLLAERAINIRSEVRSAYIAYRATYDISWQYRNRILPLRETIDEQALLEYSGMITDVFDLLTTASESIDSNVAAIEAKRDFFLAAVDFQAALIGGSGEAAAGEAEE